MTLAFGILSSRESPESVGQLIDALGTGARVWVHHDDAKGPGPRPLRGEARRIVDPAETAWGEWSLCEAILRLLREALTDPDWRYFQLLSGSCLPIRPIEDFARHVERSDADAHVDMVALGDDDVALMSHGFRAYAPQGTLGHRVLRRLRRWYMGPHEGSIDRKGLGFSLPTPGREDAPAARLALEGMRRIRDGTAPGLSHPFGPDRGCWVGSTWWGARREVCEWIVAQPEDGELQRFFRRVLIPDEFYFQTLLGNSGFAVASSNHRISRFDDSHPVRLGLDDLADLERSDRFFARKFADDPQDPARLEILARIGAQGATRPRATRFHRGEARA